MKVIYVTFIILLVVMPQSYFLVIISALLIHELGHIICGKLFKVKIRFVTSKVLGVKLYYNFADSSALSKLFVCLSGPTFGLFFAYVIYISPIYENRFAVYFILISVSYSIFNLLPINGLDGGEILESLAGIFFLPNTAYHITKTVSLVTSLLFWALTVNIQLSVGENYSMMIIALYFLYRSLF